MPAAMALRLGAVPFKTARSSRGRSTKLLAKGWVPVLRDDPAGAIVMFYDRDIWRTANIVVKRHGEDSALVAAQRADKMLAEGDAVGQAVWKRILCAVKELRRLRPIDDERVN